MARHSFLKAVPLDQVQAIFISDFQRDCFEWQQDHTHIEIALDEGQLYCPAGRRSQAIAELELELELEQKQGTPEALYQLGLQLTQQYPLFLEVTSKAAQGYALANASEPPVLHQDHLDAASKTTCFHRLMQHHRQLRQLPNDLNWAHFKVNLSHWNEHHAQKPAFLELTNSETYLAAAQLQLEGPPFAHWALSEALALYP